jgi:hypothetical protein
VSLDPFRNDHQLERRARSRGDGFFLTAFQWLSRLMLGFICIVVIVPLVVLAYRAITAREPPPIDVTGEIRNVHSLGINPKDGALYAATLRGLYRVDGLYSAKRIAESYQENRGFTVIGPDRFISSGRPDLRDLISDFEPEMMGLQRSDDAGRSWHSLSLKGEATFSHLAVSDGLIYGYESRSATLMVSRDDGRTWEGLSSLPPLLDLAVNPNDAQALVALTENALMRSQDGGRSWQPLVTPDLLLIDWQAQLWGVDEAGTVLRSDDLTAWESMGTLPGPVEAFLVAQEGLHAAVRGQGIFTSSDSGKSWLALYLLPVPF